MPELEINYLLFIYCLLFKSLIWIKIKVKIQDLRKLKMKPWTAGGTMARRGEGAQNG
jgi:hypothetical protein